VGLTAHLLPTWLPPAVQELAVCAAPSCGTLLMCRLDQEHTPEPLRPLSAHVDAACSTDQVGDPGSHIHVLATSPICSQTSLSSVMNRMDPRTNGRSCKQWRPERSLGKRRLSQRMSQEPAPASVVERVPEAGSCSSVAERAVAALASPPDGFPVLSQVVARWVPPRSDLATSCWQAHC
jgi:hypothetical protein